MVDLLKPKETPKASPEKVEQAAPSQEVGATEPQEVKEPEARPEQEPRAEQSREQLQGSWLPTVSQHVGKLTERVATPHTKSERLIEIEKVMSEGLEEIYAVLPVEAQAAVKYEGEVAAAKIEYLIESGKEISKKVLSILRSWLAKIPGVSKFFLEQESKRKTDKIMAIARKTRG